MPLSSSLADSRFYASIRSIVKLPYTQVRASYKNLIEEHAEWFFSDPARCRMDEDIHLLEVRPKGDIFESRQDLL